MKRLTRTVALILTLIILAMAWGKYASAAAPVIWQNGQYGKFLTSLGFFLNDDKEISSISVDPSAGAGVAAQVGSIRLRDNAGVGELWFKSGAANTAWINAATAATPGWLLTGNAGTNDAVNFLGTTDGEDLVFKSNAIEAFRVAAGTSTVSALSNVDFTLQSNGTGDIVVNTGGATERFRILDSASTLQTPNNIDMTLQAQGTGDVVINTNSTERIRVLDSASTVQSPANVDFTLQTAAGTGDLVFNTNAVEKFRILDSSSTLQSPVNAAMIFESQGTGDISFMTNGSTRATIFDTGEISASMTFVVPVDGAPGFQKNYSFESEFDAQNDNTDKALMHMSIDNHYDRSHSGQDAASVVSTGISGSVEGSGTVTNQTVLSLNQNLLGDTGGTTNTATLIGASTALAANYNVGDYFGLNLSTTIDPLATLTNLYELTLSTSGDVSNLYNGIQVNHSGNTGSYTGLNVLYSGAGNTGNYEGVHVIAANGTATSKSAFLAYLGDGVTAGSGRVLDGSWGDGDYDNRIGVNINGGTGDITAGGETGFNVSPSAGAKDSFTGVNVTPGSGGGTTSGNWTGVQISGNDTVAGGVTGISSDVSGIDGGATQKVSGSFNGGALNVTSPYDTSILPASPGFAGTNSIGGQLTIANGSPMTNTFFIANNMASVFNANDDMGPDAFTGTLGFTFVGEVGQLSIAAGKTVDTINMSLAGVGVPAGSGTLTNYNMYSALGALNQGGTVSIGTATAFEGQSGICTFATNCYGLSIDDSTAANYMAGHLGVGTVTKSSIATTPYSLQVQQNTTDQQAGAGYFNNQSQSTANNANLVSGVFGEAKAQVDAGVSTLANTGGMFQAYRNAGAPDDGSMALLVGVFGNINQIATGAAASTSDAAGILTQQNMTSGNATNVYDFYAMPGVLTGSTVTNRFGIYISPDDIGTKNNYLAGNTVLGGAYATPSEVLTVNGNALIPDNALILGDTGGGTNTITVQAPADASLTADWTLTLPANDGNANEVLTTDGSGVTSWAPAPASTPQLFGTRAAGRSISAGSGIASAGSDMSTTAGDQLVFVVGNAGPVDITANPQIEAGTIVGQRLKVCGTDDTNTVKLDNGNGLSMNGFMFLTKDHCIDFFWGGSDGSTSDWIEAGRN